MHAAGIPDDDARILRCEVRPERQVVIVAPTGELDLAGVPTIDAQLGELHEAGFAHLAVDLRGLRFMDSTGLRLLLRWTAAAASDGYRFSVIPGPPQVQRVLAMTGVESTLDMVSERDLVN